MALHPRGCSQREAGTSCAASGQTDPLWTVSLHLKLPGLSPKAEASEGPGPFLPSLGSKGVSNFSLRTRRLSELVGVVSAWQVLLGVPSPGSPSALSVETRLKWPNPCLGDTGLHGGWSHFLTLACSLALCLALTHSWAPHTHRVLAGGVCPFRIALNPGTLPSEGPRHFSSPLRPFRASSPRALMYAALLLAPLPSCTCLTSLLICIFKTVSPTRQFRDDRDLLVST